MPRRLASTVYLHDADGNVQAFGPGDDVPAWAAKQIPNPKAWAEDDDPDPAGAKPAGNASTQAWAEYATGQGHDVAGMSRDELRALFTD